MHNSHRDSLSGGAFCVHKQPLDISICVCVRVCTSVLHSCCLSEDGYGIVFEAVQRETFTQALSFSSDLGSFSQLPCTTYSSLKEQCDLLLVQVWLVS